jgi:hypothetical protein
LCAGYLIHFHAESTVIERCLFRPEKSWTCCEDTDEADNYVIEHFKALFLGPTLSLPGVLETAASAS